MSRQTELAKNTLILAIGKICTQFISFLLLPLYTAFLLPEEYGIVDLFNTYITLLIPIFGWQFDNGMFRFLLDHRDREEEQKKIFSTVIASNVVQSMFYIVFFAIAQNFITADYKLFLAIDVVLNIFLNTLLQFPRGLGNSIQYSLASFISASSTIVLNVWFIAGMKMGPQGMFLATVLAKIVAIVYLCVASKVWRYFSTSKINKQYFKDILKFSFPLIPNQLSWWVVGVSDRTIISWVLGVAKNGVYSVANKFPSVFITFYNIFSLSWTETVSLHIDDEDRDSFLTDTINSIFKLFASVCLMIISVMPFVYPYMVNKQYKGAYEQIPILMLSVLFQVVVSMYSAIYIAKKKSVEVAKTSIFAAIINITVNIALINVIGLYAASISTVMAYAVMAVYRYFDCKKYVRVILEIKTLLPVVIGVIFTFICYYRNKLITNILSLAVVFIYSVVVNKSFILFCYNKLMNLLFRKRKNNTN